jgi:hypothetical protein
MGVYVTITIGNEVRQAWLMDEEHAITWIGDTVTALLRQYGVIDWGHMTIMTRTAGR